MTRGEGWHPAGRPFCRAHSQWMAGRIEPPVVGQIEGDAPGREDAGVFLEAFDQLLGRRLLLGLTQAFLRWRMSWRRFWRSGWGSGMGTPGQRWAGATLAGPTG